VAIPEMKGAGARGAGAADGLIPAHAIFRFLDSGLSVFMADEGVRSPATSPGER